MVWLTHIFQFGVVRPPQEKLKKEFINKDGKMLGANVSETRAPQAFGVLNKDALCKFLKIKKEAACCGFC